MNIKLNGELIPDEWAEIYRYFGYDTGYYCPQDILAAMEELQDGEELTLLVNSVGGSVDAAAEIYAALKACKNPTRAVIESIAASAASYLILGADRVEIYPPAQMMIHCSSCGASGNKFDHQWAAEALDKQDMSILDTYCVKCGETHREELRAAMEAETYLTARECLDLGLVDEVIGMDDGQEPEPTLLVAAVSNNLIRAMRTLPDIRELTEKRDRLLEDGQNEAEKARAALALEQARYI